MFFPEYISEDHKCLILPALIYYCIKYILNIPFVVLAYAPTCSTFGLSINN